MKYVKRTIGSVVCCALIVGMFASANVSAVNYVGTTAGVSLSLAAALSEDDTIDATALRVVTTELDTIALSGATAGVTTALSESIVEDDDASVSSLGADVTASGEEAIDCTYFGYENMGIAVLDGGNLNVREEASTDATLVGKMTDGAACEILSEEDGWYYITSGNVTGYVSADYIVTGEEAVAIALEEYDLYATVLENGLRVRAEANTDSDIIYLVSEGEKFVVTDQLDEWVEIQVDDELVYVYAEYVSIAEELPTAMTMSEVRYGTGVSQDRCDLCNYALEFVGNPYVWGGTSLTNGCDCSGFVLSIFEQWGIYLPHYSAEQSTYGTQISASEAQPGDLFFYGSGSTISHVGIYIGNGQIVHAASESVGIIVSSAYYKTPICVVSLLD